MCTNHITIIYRLSLLCFLHNFISLNLVQTLPQLDLPPLINPTPKPEIYYNGFPPSGQFQTLGDFDRDQRYGPPYKDDNNPDDGSDDFRVSSKYFFNFLEVFFLIFSSAIKLVNIIKNFL